MRMSWLIVLAALVAGVAALFATTMASLARLNAEAPAQPVTSPVSARDATPVAVAPATDAGPGGSAALQATLTPGPALVATAPETPRSSPASEAGTASAHGMVAAEQSAPTVPAVHAQAPRPGVAPPAAVPAVAVDARTAAQRPGMAATANGTAPAPTAVDPRSARCRSLADYLRDLDAEEARTSDAGRQEWLTAQRNTAQERQLELGC